MKRKPILFDKISGTHRTMGREVIGLIGTHHGVGVTHTGLMLAFYMGEERGKKTAFVELNTHGDMEYIQKAYDWTLEEEASFSFHRVTCYKKMTGDRMGEIFSGDFDCIIIDFGIDLVFSLEEFLRCSSKLVIGGKSEWDLYKLIHFSNAAKKIPGSETWLYFIPQANNKTIAKIKKEATKKVWAVPVNDEPVLPSQTMNRLFGRIF